MFHFPFYVCHLPLCWKSPNDHFALTDRPFRQWRMTNVKWKMKFAAKFVLLLLTKNNEP